MPLQPAPEQGLESVFGLESFPLCYTAGRHEGARQEAKVELMTEPADRAVLLLQRVSELLLESRAIVQQLEVARMANRPPIPPTGSPMASSWPRSKRGL